MPPRSSGPGVLAPALLGAVWGTGLQLQQPELPGAAVHGAVGLAAMLLAGCVWHWRPSGRPWLCALLALCAAAALAWAVTGVRALQHRAAGLPPHLEGRDLAVVGVVAGLPRQGEQGVQFEFDIESAEEAGVAVAAPERVRLSWSSAFPGADRGAEPLAHPVRVGERWRFSVRLHRPHGLSNPAGFDTELWMWERGLHATGHVRRGRAALAPQRMAQTWAHPIQQARQHMRERLQAAVPSPRAAGVLVALVVGDQAAIGADDWAVFRSTGVAHLVSVSGLHVTMFAWLAVRLLGRVWRGVGRYRPGLLLRVPTPVAAGLGGVALAAGYAAFSGWGVPSQRTVLMLAAVTALRLTGRRWPWPMVWLLAANAVLWVDPWALLQPGFWLSFVAVGVLFASSGPAVPVADGPAWRGQLRDLLRTQAVVTVALAPLTLLLFGQFSLVGLVANLFAIPWVTLLVTPLAMLGTLLPGLWSLGALAVEAWLWCLHGMAQWPLAAVERPALPLGLAWLAALGGVLLVLRLPWSWRAWALLLLWPALAYTPLRPLPGHFELLAPDVGQGTAVVVRTAQHTLLFDTGPPQGASDAAERVLLPWLRALGDRPDRVVISHGDIDHAAGVHTLDRAFPRAQWSSSVDEAALAEVAGAPLTLSVGVPRLERCVAGQSWDWDGVRFEVLHPREADYAAGLSDNALSCVLRVGGDAGALLTGDIGIAEETRLALAQPELRAALLVVAHHGSHSSSGPVWLNTLRPRLAIVQAGHRNRYGHPAPVVVRRLEARGIEWVGSPACGAATWRSWAPQTLACHRRVEHRYWHDSWAAEPPPN